MAEALRLAEESGLPRRRIAAEAGVFEHCLRDWASGVSSPGVGRLRAVLNTLGYDLAVVPKDE